MRKCTACFGSCAILLLLAAATLLTMGCAGGGQYQYTSLKVLGASKPPVRITFGACSELQPSVSMDGGQIAFIQDDAHPETGEETWDIWRCSAVNGSGLTVVRNSKYDEERPTWYPDGESILYQQLVPRAWNQDRVGEIWRALKTGIGGTTKIGAMEQSCLSPAISPDGTMIAFVTDLPDVQMIPNEGLPYVELREEDPQIWIMRADGGEPRPLDSGSWPAWSPDGTKIAYQKWVNDQWDVWVVTIDGSSPGPVTGGMADDCWPCWSPSGREIVYASNPDPNDVNWDIYIVNSRGGPPTRITETNSQEKYPAWGPGGVIFFCSDNLEPDFYDIWRAELMPRPLE